MADSLATPAPSAPAAPPPAAPAPAASSSVAPSSGGAGMDFDTAFDAVMGGGATPSEGGETPDPGATPEVVTGDAPVDHDSAVVEPSPEDEALAAQGEAATPEEIDPYEEIKADSISSDGKRHFFRKAKAEAMMASHKAMLQLREIDPGITVDGVRALYTRGIEMDRLIDDFGSGDPRRVASVSASFVHQSSNPQSVAMFLDSGVLAAKQVHPQAYQAVRNRILLNQAEELAKSPNEADRVLAWNLDYLVRGDNGDYGRYKTAPQQQSADPNAQVQQQRQQLNQERAQFNQQKQREHQQRVQYEVNSTINAASTAIDKVISNALAVIPANVREKRDFEYKATVRDLREKFDSIASQTDIYRNQYNNLLNQVRTNPTEQARNALLQFVEQRAQYVIGKLAKEARQRFNDSVLTNSDAQHQKQAALQARREPGGNGAPVQRGVGLAAKVRHLGPNPSNDALIEAAFG